MKLMLTAMVTMGVIYTNMSNPLMFMLIIMAQALMICVTSWAAMNSSWFAYILFLIFLGGLMVLFIYITSLASNELFKLDTKTATSIVVSLSGILTILFFINQEMKTPQSINLTNSFLLLYSSNFKFTLILAMVYLLLTLIVAVKIANKLDAPIKNLI